MPADPNTFPFPDTGESPRYSGTTLCTTSYSADGTVLRETYGNGGRVDYVYDSFKRVTDVKFDGAGVPGSRISTGTTVRWPR